MARASGRTAEGFRIGGKTGTAEKAPRRRRLLCPCETWSTFASAFPMDDPRYVVVAMARRSEGLEGDLRAW